MLVFGQGPEDFGTDGHRKFATGNFHPIGISGFPQQLAKMAKDQFIFGTDGLRKFPTGNFLRPEFPV